MRSRTPVSTRMRNLQCAGDSMCKRLAGMSCLFGMSIYAGHISSHAIETERKLFVALRMGIEKVSLVTNILRRSSCTILLDHDQGKLGP